VSHLPPNIARKTQTWFRPHSLGGLVGIAFGAFLPILAIIFRLPMTGPRFMALAAGLLVLPIAVDAHLYLARMLRVVRDTPATPVARTKRGYTKISGTAEAIAGRILQSPLSDTPCVWHLLEDRGGKRGSYSSGSPFLLRDATGACLVDVDDAQVYGHKARGAAFPAGSWKYGEYVIEAGDQVHVIGDLAFVPAADAPRPRSAVLAGQPDRVRVSDEAWERAMDYEYVDEVSRDVGQPSPRAGIDREGPAQVGHRQAVPDHDRRAEGRGALVHAAHVGHQDRRAGGACPGDRRLRALALDPLSWNSASTTSSSPSTTSHARSKTTAPSASPCSPAAGTRAHVAQRADRVRGRRVSRAHRLARAGPAERWYNALRSIGEG
jgi:hypothetical protein